MIKNGMIVTYSDKNIHSSGAPTAYGGITGAISSLGEDNSFVIKAKGCTLVVPMHNHWGKREKGVWLVIEGKEVYVRSMETAYEKKQRLENSFFARMFEKLKLFQLQYV